MTKPLRMLVAALFCGLWMVPVAGQTETVTGEVISVRCYLQNKANVGKTGFVCAIGDVKWEGNPPGLLTTTGKLYQLAGGLVADNNAKVIPHLGQTVTVTGTIVVKSGTSILSANELTVASK